MEKEVSGMLSTVFTSETCHNKTECESTQQKSVAKFNFIRLLQHLTLSHQNYNLQKTEFKWVLHKSRCVNMICSLYIIYIFMYIYIPICMCKCIKCLG